MLTQNTLQTLRALRLSGMADAFSRQLEQPAAHDLSFEDRFALIVDYEATHRGNRKLQRLLKNARLKEAACIEDVDYTHRSGLEKRQMASFASCSWIKSHHNICLTGPTGTGKTWLACALGHAACRQGFSVLYVRAPRIFEELRVAHGDGSFARRIAQLAKLDLLIIDDWGLDPLSRSDRHDLLEIMEDRHLFHSTLITSQLPTENWHEHINDPTVADAILDRVLHNSYKIALKGASMRKLKASLQQFDEVPDPSHPKTKRT
jgi:DNA replication protein DnaC